VIKKITDDINKSKSNTISFDEFKVLWKKEKQAFSSKDTSQKLFNLLLETVNSNTINENKQYIEESFEYSGN